MFGLGAGEIVLVLVIALVLLGPKRLPELATNIGKGLREFNKARQGIFDSIERPITDVQREVTSSVSQTISAPRVESPVAANPSTVSSTSVNAEGAERPILHDSANLIDDKQGKA